MMEGTTGVTEQQTVNKPVVPSKPVTVPSKPRRTISANELDEADAALIAAAEGQDIGLGTPAQPTATAAPSSVDTSDTEKENL